MKKILLFIFVLFLFSCESKMDIGVPSDLKTPSVIYFSSEQCPWCRSFNPTWESVKTDTIFKNITFIKDNHYDVFFDVQSLPTLVFINKNKEVIKRVGYMGEKSFRKHLKKFL